MDSRDGLGLRDEDGEGGWMDDTTSAEVVGDEGVTLPLCVRGAIFEWEFNVAWEAAIEAAIKEAADADVDAGDVTAVAAAAAGGGVMLRFLTAAMGEIMSADDGSTATTAVLCERKKRRGSNKTLSQPASQSSAHTSSETAGGLKAAADLGRYRTRGPLCADAGEGFPCTRTHTSTTTIPNEMGQI